MQEIKIAHRSILAVFAAVIVLTISLTMPAFATGDSSVANSNESTATSIRSGDAPFGLTEVTRNQTGFNKTYQGTSYGYVFPLGKTASSHFTILVLSEEIVVYIPTDMASNSGFTLSDKQHQETFIQMVQELDTNLSEGGTQLKSLDLPYNFISSDTYKKNGITYTFDQEIEEGYYYTTCTGRDKDIVKSSVDFCLYGQVLPSSEVQVSEQGTWFEELANFLNPDNFDYQPLWVSLRTAGVAMIFIFILGIFAARMSMGVKSRWKGLLDSIFTIPMVLPPTVVGFILLVIFGRSTEFGRFLLDHGIELVFSWPAAVMAATIVGFPLMYRTVLGAFESLDTNMLDAARTLGWSEGRIFRKLMLPLAWPSIAAGIVLAFARAMGEFGATLFVAGNYAGVTQTMPIAIYFSWMGGNSPVAIFWVVVVILISFIIILIINIYTAHAQNYRKAGGKGSKDDTPQEEGEVSFSIDKDIASELGFTYKGKRGKVSGDAYDQKGGQL